jgi:hypothetical protein
MGLINDCAMKKYGECEVYLETFLGTRMKWCFSSSTHWNGSFGKTLSQSGCYSVPARDQTPYIITTNRAILIHKQLIMCNKTADSVTPLVYKYS